MRPGEEARPRVCDLAVGQTVTGVYGVAGKRLRSFRDASKGQYLEVDLRDVTGVIPGRVWEDAGEIAAGFDVGDVVRVQAQVTEYRGQEQLVITGAEVVAVEEVPVERFIPASPRPLEEMERQLWRRVESVRDPHLSRLLLDLYGRSEFYSAFISAPAAKMVHHNYLNGLLEHSLQVVSLLETSFESGGMNRDLLVTGGLLHDAGKVEEFDCRGAIDYSERGRLIGHVVSGFYLVREAIGRIEDFPRDLGLHLEHLILSHHGRQEYGAPVLPQTREAVALHHADLYSSKVAQMASVSERARDSGRRWSEYDPMLGRYVWIPDGGTEEAP
ncbi:MAG: HD domain-containing protein [Bacillota bacterium]